jgi:hypothetical protein
MTGFCLGGADFRGFVGLSDGAKAGQEIQLSVGVGNCNEVATEFSRQEWTGPIMENFLVSTSAPKALRVNPLACGRGNTESRILISTKLRMMQTRADLTSDGLLSVDSTDGKLIQRFRMQAPQPALRRGGPFAVVCGQ